METTLSKKTPYAPVNEINGGTVSYLKEGWDSAIKARRNNAYKKMHDFCKGDYKILQDGEQLGDGTAFPVGDTVIYGQERRQQIKFECVHQ